MAGMQQLNVSYSPAEDRLLFRMTVDSDGGPAEYRLWLTRRFVQVFWNALDRLLETEMPSEVMPGGSAAMKQFQQEAALAGADFETPYQDDRAVVRPLGEIPLLITRLQIRKRKEQRYTLSFFAADDQGVNLGANISVVHSLRKLLAEATAKAEWGLPFSSAAVSGASGDLQTPTPIN